MFLPGQIVFNCTRLVPQGVNDVWELSQYKECLTHFVEAGTDKIALPKNKAEAAELLAAGKIRPSEPNLTLFAEEARQIDGYRWPHFINTTRLHKVDPSIPYDTAYFYFDSRQEPVPSKRYPGRKEFNDDCPWVYRAGFFRYDSGKLLTLADHDWAPATGEFTLKSLVGGHPDLVLEFPIVRVPYEAFGRTYTTVAGNMNTFLADRMDKLKAHYGF